MSKEWYLRSDKGIKIFSHLYEDFITLRSPGQKEEEAEVLTRKKAREKWRELLSIGYTQIDTNDDDDDSDESLHVTPKTYWGENSGDHANIDFPMELLDTPERTFGENNENSTFFDSDDYESVQDQV